MLPGAFYCCILNVNIAAPALQPAGAKWGGEEEEGGGRWDHDCPLTFCHHLSHVTGCKRRQSDLDERVCLPRELVIMCKAQNT